MTTTVFVPMTFRRIGGRKRIVLPDGSLPEIPLSSVQRAIATACGYRDWHELEISHAAAESSVLDEHLTEGGRCQRF